MPARANPLPARVDIRADAIDFFSGAMLVAARGHVLARMRGRTITGDELRYDLGRNTLLIAGNVHVTTAATAFDAAAYVLDLPADKAVLLRLDPLPATFLLADDDIANAVETPVGANVFAAVDIEGARPFIRSTHASIVPGAHVRFTPARFPTGAGITMPSPSYLYTFAPNPNFEVPPATLPAYSFDQAYGLLGTPHSLLAGHLRYGSSSGANLAVDEHLVDGLQRYAVGSFLVRGRRFDLGAFEQLNPHLNQSFASSLADGDNTVHYALEHTSRLLTTTISYTQIQGDASEDIQTNTSVLPIGHLLSYKLSADYGFDAFEGNLPFPLDFRTTLGAQVFTPSVRGPLGTSLSGQYALQSTSYDYPHQIGSGTALVSLSRSFHSMLFYANASIAQIYDRFNLPAPWQYWGYSPTQIFTAPDGTQFAPPSSACAPIAGTCIPSPFALCGTGRGAAGPCAPIFSYNGVGTLRTYFAGLSINPNPNFNLNLSLTRSDDFPQFNGYGAPPWSASFDLRIRPVPNLAIEYGRTYVFGWDGEHLTPQYTLGISP